MTTIAYRDKVMAADTQMTNGDRKLYGVQKVFGTYQKILVGVCGPVPCMREVLDWVSRAHGEYGSEILSYANYDDFGGEDAHDASILIAVKSTEELFLVEDRTILEIPTGFYALGTGADYALGAMAAGATAAHAVELASRFDVYSGGGPQTVSFSP